MKAGEKMIERKGKERGKKRCLRLNVGDLVGRKLVLFQRDLTIK